MLKRSRSCKRGFRATRLPTSALMRAMRTRIYPSRTFSISFLSRAIRGLDAVRRRFVHAIAEGATAVLLVRIEKQPHRHRVDDWGTAADVIAVGN